MYRVGKYWKNRKKSFVSETFIMSQDCFLNSKDGENCGSSCGLSGLVRLSECNDEVKHHLISCHLSKEVLSENELILARTGLFHLAQEHKQKMWISYRHRHTLGKFWRSARIAMVTDMTSQIPLKYCPTIELQRFV